MERCRSTLALAVGLASVLAGCSGGDEPVYPLSSCRVLTVIDAQTDRLVAGVEDIALSTDRSTLYLSAYDRLSFEADLDEGVSPREGGIYALPIEALSQSSVTVTSIFPRSDDSDVPAFPHGIAVDGDRLIVVNRRPSSAGTTADILSISLDGERAAEVLTEDACAANDVTVQNSHVLVSYDRARCPGWSFTERLGAACGRVEDVTLGEDRLDGLAFANGVSTLDGGDLVVAETRGKRLRFFDGEEERRVNLPGAPDNISVSDDGYIIAAVQPDLIAFARYRYGHRDAAASRIVSIDPITEAVETLVDDPSGSLFSGATVGVHVGDYLVAGSVRDDGILVCGSGRAE